MPEGPEVRRMAQQLSAFTKFRRIADVTIVGGRYKDTSPDGSESFPMGLMVQDVKTHGKFLYWVLENEWSIWCTMGMSGTWRRSRFNQPLEPDKHDAIVFKLRSDTTNGNPADTEISFNDVRHFGTVKFVRGSEALKEKLESLGFDPFDGLPSMKIHELLQKKKWAEKPICDVMMDQSVFAGVGNYIRAEALYAAKISPWRKGKNMTRSDVAGLCLYIETIMKNSYDSGGATILTYVDANGHAGQYASKFAVYGKDTDHKGNEVITELSAGKRTIHWCPEVQT